MTTDRSQTDRARRYDRDHARRLRSLAYRMLGSRADAEDIVQEAWLRWADVDEGGVANAGAYLSRLVTNLCLDKIGSAAARREQYVGVWLPEPVLDDELHFGSVPGPEQQAEFAEDVSVAFMLTLERLSPLERAAFLLKDVFDLEFAEVASHLNRTEAACRQLVSRARRSVKEDYARREVTAEEHQRLSDAFVEAVLSRDVSGLAHVLSADVVMLADGGGKVTAVPKPVRGRDLVSTVFIGFAKLPAATGWRLQPARINGLPGFLVFDTNDGGRLIQTITLAPSATEPGHIGAVYVMRNPDKLGLLVTNADAASS